MKRLILSFVAALAVAGALPTSSAADGPHGGGQGNGHGAGGGGAERGGAERGGADRGGAERGDGRRAAAPRAAPAPRAERDDDRPGRGPEGPRFERPRAAPYTRPAESPRAYGVRRGGYLPPQGAGPVIQDHSRYNLRAPPRGFSWVATPRGYALVNEDTGQIFDLVPGR